MNILIIEDDSEVAEFITIAFELTWPGARIKRTHLGREAVKLIEQQSYNLVILDLGLPDTDGYEVLKSIRQVSSVPVIIATARNTEAEIVKGLGYGADDYIVKPFGQLELVARGRAVQRRLHDTNIYSSVIRGPLRLEPGRGELICGAKKIHVTRTESLILGLLLKNLGSLVTYSQLEEAIWGEPGICPNASDSIRVYISRLRTKISRYTECKIVIQAHSGAGYTLDI